MLGDVATPIRKIDDSRDEIILVAFDGFIKNSSEGIIRTMLRTDEDWIERYPELSMFDEMEQQELYDNTMLLQPKDLLRALSREALSEEEVEKDLGTIIPDVLIHLSKITSFEFALYQLLGKRFVKKVIIWKEDLFYENEIEYLDKQYEDYLPKIEYISGGLITVIQEQKPTTVCISDINFPLYYIPEQEDMSLYDGMLFILLNSALNVTYQEDTDKFIYLDEFSNRMRELNENDSIPYAVSAMFNFALDVDTLIDQENNEEGEKNDE